MDFTYTDTQDMVRDTLSRFLADTYDFETRQKFIASDDGRDPAIWTALAQELGMLGASFSEDHGGLGGGALENAIIMEELGKVLGIEPYLPTVVIAGGALKAVGGAQADKYIPEIIAGNMIVAFAYAEPQGRYDLANLKTSAKKEGDGYVLNGHKGVVYAAPWATHLLVTARTGGNQRDRDGVSLFLIDAKLPGIVRRDYPTVDGSRASEIYFENVEIPADALLGGEEGQGFKQLMRTFEGARIQTAARAVGVARRALELGLDYARTRKQFGKPIVHFPRVSDKLAMSLVDFITARELSYAAARAKDSGKRCDIEAGMAKLLGARAAWSNADAALQIHGGNGYALEYEISRILCDARILNIFEGAAEIQAQVIARGLTGGRN